MNPTKTILRCAEDSSTTAKVSILQADGSELLKKCLNYALDPYKVYGIKKYEFINPIKKVEDADNWDIIFDCLEKLMRRHLTGDSARSYITKCSGFLLEDQQKMFGWILNKDFRAGIAEGIVNKAFPKLIPEFEVQLAQPQKFLKKVIYPCIVQPKMDGVRTIAIVDPKENSVIYYSRNGKIFENFKCFDKELLKLSRGEPKMFDGEVIGPKGDDFRGIMQQVRRKYDVEPKGLNYYLFDWMPVHHFVRQYATLVQQERSDFLEESEGVFLDYTDERRIQIVNSRICNTEEEVMAFYDVCVQQDGFEGVIIKDIKGEYDFKRSNVWIKMKPSDTKDFKIIDIQEGTGKYKGLLGAIIVENDGVKVNVGSGFKDCERIKVEEAYKELVGKTVEVEFDTTTPDGSLRFPRFKQIREDK